MRVDLVWFLPEESSDGDPMGKFDKLREKEERLGEVLASRMHDKKEVTAAIGKVRCIQKRTNVGLVA